MFELILILDQISMIIIILTLLYCLVNMIDKVLIIAKNNQKNKIYSNSFIHDINYCRRI